MTGIKDCSAGSATKHHREARQPQPRGVNYRFQWEQTTGLIKVVPSGPHEGATHQFSTLVTSKLIAMGIPSSARGSGRRRTALPLAKEKRAIIFLSHVPVACQPSAGPPWSSKLESQSLSHGSDKTPPSGSQILTEKIVLLS